MDDVHVNLQFSTNLHKISHTYSLDSRTGRKGFIIYTLMTEDIKRAPISTVY